MNMIEENPVHPVILSKKYMTEFMNQSTCEAGGSWREGFVQAPGSLQRNGRAASGPEQTDGHRKP